MSENATKVYLLYVSYQWYTNAQFTQKENGNKHDKCMLNKSYLEDIK